MFVVIDFDKFFEQFFGILEFKFFNVDLVDIMRGSEDFFFQMVKGWEFFKSSLF